MLKIKQESNYLASIVKLGKPIPHPNADRLIGFIINHEIVYTDLSYKEGDMCVLFPLGSKINSEFLSFLNAFRDSTKNRNTSIKGYFEDSCRVRAQPLRGEPSNGVLFNIETLEEWLSYKLYNRKETLLSLSGNESIIDGYPELIGTEFDSYGDITICEKYIPPVQKEKQGGGSNTRASKKKIARIVDGQFSYHYDTNHFKKVVELMQPTDTVVITFKIHGCSCISGNLLVKRDLTWYERLLCKLNVKIQDTKYDLVCSSRNVIKLVGEQEKNKGGYYDTNTHVAAHNTIKDKILPGITLYYEIAGYNTSGSWIQKNYDYGHEPKEFGIYVYRITYTSPQGHVTEYTWKQIEKYCEKYDLKTVPVLYYGELNNIVKPCNNWHDKLYTELANRYTEKNCFMCKNPVPEEGVCIRNESTYQNTILWRTFKLKSFRMIQLEQQNEDSL